MQSEREFMKDRVNCSVTCESQGEYILPDYNSDVKKILFTEAYAVPSGKFFDAEALEYTGAVNYSVVYLDSENNLAHTSFSTDYEFKTRCDKDRYVDSELDTIALSYSLRPVGPRKLLAKATLEAEEHVCQREEYTPEGDALCREDLEKRTRKIKVRGVGFYKSEEREYADMLCRIDGAIADEIDVVFLKPRVIKNEVRIADNEYTVTGEIRVEAVVKNGEEMPTVYEKVIPFNDTIPYENSFEKEIMQAKVDILSCKTEVNPDESGVYVSVSLITEIKLRVSYNDSVEMLSDCYLKENECENKYKDFEYEELVLGKRVNEQLTAELTKKDIGVEELRNVIYSDATLKLDRMVVQGNGVVLEGKARVSGIACEINNDGAVGYTGVKFDFPFKKNVNCDCQFDVGTRIECTLDVLSAFCECDNDNVYPSVNISCDLTFIAPKRVKAVASSTSGEATSTPSSSVITVYYPEREDTLFDVAKKFHTSSVKVAVDNSLTENVVSGEDTSLILSGVDFLIIKP